MNIRVERELGVLGAELSGVDLSQPIDSATQKEIVNAWLKYQVIVFRNQILSDEQLVRFSQSFGILEKAPIPEKAVGVASIPRLPEVTVVSNVIENGSPLGALGDGELTWHSDMTYVENPPPASILYSVEVPPFGGDTWFSNMYLAFDALPQAVKNRISDLQAKHNSTYTSAGTLRRGFEEVDDVSTAPGALHPIVLVHPETQKRALYLGRRLNSFIPGLSLSESEAFLDELWAYAEDPQFAIAHQWKKGDVVMWDNRAVMHRRDAFDPKVRRILHRTQLLTFKA
jgi:taurine dioxygenase